MKIVVVEDQTMMRMMLEQVCQRCPVCEFAGQASCGAEAIELVSRHRPDLLILDLSLPDIDGFAVARAARAMVPGLRVLVLTSHLSTWTIYRVERERYQGFLDKESARGQCRLERRCVANYNSPLR